GRRQEDRSADRHGHRPAGVRQASFPDSVRRDRQEVGADRRVGLGRQRRHGPAGEAPGDDGDDRGSVTPSNEQRATSNQQRATRGADMKIVLTTAIVALVASAASADPLTCNVTAYKALPGLTATVADNTLTLAWDGDRNQEVRLRLAVVDRTPTIR